MPHFRNPTLIAVGLVLGLFSASNAETAPTLILFQNVRIFDGKLGKLSPQSNVLVIDNLIAKISTGPINYDPAASVTKIEGHGNTLMPGLIDAHTHVMLAGISQSVALTSDVAYLNVVATKTASEMLQHGFTSIRDMAGPAFSIKRGIDEGIIPGPRIWPSGAFISQSGGHGDFRMPNELPAPPGYFAFSERVGASMIADSPDEVRKRTREQLALGASQIKLVAGGGVASPYDPLDVTQYTIPEIRAAVEAAENWGTYVTVHAYTPRAIKQAIEAGVKCIEHGQLADEESAKLMARKGVWWSIQPFSDDGSSAYKEGSPSRLKQLEMFRGTELAYKLAKKHKIKTAWGTDILFNPRGSSLQGRMLEKMEKWYSPAEILKMATSDNAELLALSGPRNPYPGKLGVVQEGALADVLLVKGDPLKNLSVLSDPERSLLVIVKNGQLFKNINP